MCESLLCVCVHSPNMLSLKLFTDSSVCPSCLPNCPSNRSVCILILTAHRLRQSPTVRCPYAQTTPPPLRPPYWLSITLGFSLSLSVSLSVPLSVWLPRFVCQSVSPTDTLNIIMQPRHNVVPRRCCCLERVQLLSGQSCQPSSVLIIAGSVSPFLPTLCLTLPVCEIKSRGNSEAIQPEVMLRVLHRFSQFCPHWQIYR